MKHILKLAFFLTSAGLGLWVGVNGIVDFNDADTGVEVFKALFWMIVGIASSILWTQDFKREYRNGN